MTDYTDLIARLRGNDMPWSVKDAADALEAQARRIVELEEGLKLERDTGTRLWEGALAYMKERNEARARIAELKAALKPFADKADKAEGPFEPPYPVDYSLWRAARAAYLGEKE
jgi:hypothetical protein